MTRAEIQHMIENLVAIGLGEIDIAIFVRAALDGLPAYCPGVPDADC